MEAEHATFCFLCLDSVPVASFCVSSAASYKLGIARLDERLGV
jgi:hypothetical protein